MTQLRKGRPLGTQYETAMMEEERRQRSLEIARDWRVEARTGWLEKEQLRNIIDDLETRLARGPKTRLRFFKTYGGSETEERETDAEMQHRKAMFYRDTTNLLVFAKAMYKHKFGNGLHI